MPSVELLINTRRFGGSLKNRSAKDHATTKLKRHQSQAAKIVIVIVSVVLCDDWCCFSMNINTLKW